MSSIKPMARRHESRENILDFYPRLSAFDRVQEFFAFALSILFYPRLSAFIRVHPRFLFIRRARLKQPWHTPRVVHQCAPSVDVRKKTDAFAAGTSCVTTARCQGRGTGDAPV